MSTSSETTYTSSTSKTETEHKTRTENDYTEQSKNTPRSKASHRCITIRGGGPASGRPRRRTRAFDRDQTPTTIVSGWSGC
ncbi:hypothetical protein Ae717Ps2_3921c [Pseudonocardia sp. Ae717_Ps2]|nr:hypothetical protein Ae717Ps2_3921c [Pseudonocardia sp. Ae717_Ps2]